VTGAVGTTPLVRPVFLELFHVFGLAEDIDKLSPWDPPIPSGYHLSFLPSGSGYRDRRQRQTFREEGTQSHGTHRVSRAAESVTTQC
jgi:hypothetical protein